MKKEKLTEEDYPLVTSRKTLYSYPAGITRREMGNYVWKGVVVARNIADGESLLRNFIKRTMNKDIVYETHIVHSGSRKSERHPGVYAR